MFAVWSFIMTLVYIIALLTKTPPTVCLSVLCTLKYFTVPLSYLLLGGVGLYLTQGTTEYPQISRYTAFFSGLILCTIVAFSPENNWLTRGMLVLIPLTGTILGCIGLIQTYNNINSGRWMAFLGFLVGLIFCIRSFHLILPALQQIAVIIYLPIFFLMEI